MPELIDREVTLQLLDKSIELFNENTLQDRMSKNGLLAARRIVSKQPTIEPEVRHGRWDEIQCFSEHGIEMASYECTSCGNDIERQRGLVPQYCEFCGAKMDATDTNVGGKGGAENG